MAGCVSPHVGDNDNPTGGGEENRLSIAPPTARIEVDPRQEHSREDAVHHVEEVARMQAERECQRARNSLNNGQADQHQIGGPEAAADRAVSKILIRAPDPKGDGEEDQGEGKADVKKSRERRHEVSLVEAGAGQRSPSRPPIATTNSPAEPATQPTASKAEWRRARRRLLSYLRTRVERGRMVGSLRLIT